MNSRNTMTAAIVSLGLHLVLLVPLAFWYLPQVVEMPQMLLETFFEQERPVEQFTRELNVQTTVSETMNLEEGGATSTTQVSAAGGVGGSSMSQAVAQKMSKSLDMKTPTVNVNIGNVAVLPSGNALGRDLGESQVSGETAAAVEGYGPALGRVTQEIIRMMRDNKVLVVWLFDESESMRDDQKEIREQFHKVYEELGIYQAREEKSGKTVKNSEILLTSICSFGADTHMLTKAPTSDTNEIRAAIDKIPIDESGKENTLKALVESIERHRQMVQTGNRKLAFIIVSDESGDDGAGIDEAIKRCKQVRAPVYVLGREAVFGFPFARIRWKDPKYGLNHWLQINRGPETPEPEALQYDGLHERWDSHSSGFGPYEQSRLARETGGIFFVLPHEEQNLVSRDAIERRKYDFLDLKQYEPELISRRDYEQQRDRSKFRAVQWQVINLLNPYRDSMLKIREIHFSVEQAEFRKAGKENFDKALRAMGLMNQAYAELEKVRPLRDKEDSPRWRANFDLISAQVLAYRVRLFQYILTMDAHAKAWPKLKDPKTNVWDMRRVQKMLPPDPEQVKATKVDPDELKRQEQKARELFQFVVAQHPRTPWAGRAEYELRVGFGMQFYEGFVDPRYRNIANDIKIPKF